MADAFVWKMDTLRPALAAIPPSLDRAITGAVGLNATRIEGWARKNAKWTDRTSNARNGLFAITMIKPMKEYRIIVSHSVPYGIWLEVRWSGKYGIIEPSVRKAGADTMTTISKYMARFS